jgi:hypothetical protein
LKYFGENILSEIVIFKENKNRIAISMVFAIVSYVYITVFERSAGAALKRVLGQHPISPWLDCSPNIGVIQMCSLKHWRQIQNS